MDKIGNSRFYRKVNTVDEELFKKKMKILLKKKTKYRCLALNIKVSSGGNVSKISAASYDKV